jgi:hypothetical protein
MAPPHVFVGCIDVPILVAPHPDDEIDAQRVASVESWGSP